MRIACYFLSTKSITMTKCAAPMCESERIANYHCTVHANHFHSKYVQYKKAEEDILPILNRPIRTNIVRQLLHYYARLKRVYELRREYRDLAFRKEYWDSGHEFRLELLLTKMVEVEATLGTIFAESTPQPEEVREAEVVDTEEVEEAVSRIERENTKIIEEERMWNEVIPAMAVERNEAIEKRERLFKYVEVRCTNVLKRMNVHAEAWLANDHAFKYLIYAYLEIGSCFMSEIDVVAIRNKPEKTLQHRLYARKYDNIEKALLLARKRIDIELIKDLVHYSATCTGFDAMLIALLVQAGSETLGKVDRDIKTMLPKGWPSNDISVTCIRAVRKKKVHVCLRLRFPEIIGECRCYCPIHYCQVRGEASAFLSTHCITKAWYHGIEDEDWEEEREERDKKREQRLRDKLQRRNIRYELRKEKILAGLKSKVGGK